MLSLMTTPDRTTECSWQETFVSVRIPRHREARNLMAFWLTRPYDGMQIGRDIPSRQIMPLLGNLTVWEPVQDGRDFVLRHMGETLRMKMQLNFPAGRLMSELLSPEFYGYHRQNFPRLCVEEGIETLDVLQGLSGSNYRHFEVVTFTAEASQSPLRWLVAGVFYF